MRHLVGILGIIFCLSAIGAPIVVKSKASDIATVNSAIAELTDYLARTADSLTVDGTEIQEIRLDCDETMGESWAMHSDGNAIVIRGGTRGVLYGAYVFIETQLGVHWWNQFEEYVPPRRAIRLEKLNASWKPSFTLRQINRSSDTLPFDDGRFAARNRLNSDGINRISMKLGGDVHWGRPNFIHTFDWYFPKGEYLAAHPDYFSLNADGKRVAGQYEGQLCLTNEAMVQEFQKKLFAFIEQDREEARKAGTAAPVLYDISINDNHTYCRCDRCNKSAAGGNQSDVFYAFLNRLAQAVAAKYPDITLTTVAYFYLIEPPVHTQIAPNVEVRFCDTMSNQIAGPLSSDNQHYQTLIKLWKSKAALSIWDYYSTYGSDIVSSRGAAFANEFTLQEQFAFYVQNNVRSLFVQMELPSDMNTMKIWLTAKMMENPTADVQKLIEQFCTLYYGAACSCVLEARKLLYSAAQRNRAYIGWNAEFSSFSYIDVMDMVKCQNLFDQAVLLVVGDATLMRRLNEARYGLDILLHRSWGRYARQWQERNGSLSNYPLNGKREVVRQRITETYKGFVDKMVRYHQGLMPKLLARLDEESQLPLVSPAPKDFTPSLIRDFTAEMFGVHAPYFHLVADKDSEAGFCLRAVLKDCPQALTPPLLRGLYNTLTRKHEENHFLNGAVLKERKEGIYQYYDLSTYDGLTPQAYLYLTNRWEIQLCMESMSQVKKARFLASVKVTGPAFFPGSTQENTFSIDRIIAIPIE